MESQKKAGSVQVGSKLRFCSLDVLQISVLSPCRRSDGEVPERSNGAVSKTVVLLAGDRGFESLPLRHLHNANAAMAASVANFRLRSKGFTGPDFTWETGFGLHTPVFSSPSLSAFTDCPEVRIK